MADKQGKKQSKYSRNRVGNDKCGPAPRRYIDQNRRFKNKLKRVEKYNGPAAAQSYHAKYAGQKYESKSLVRRRG